jgi:hypothetical protein
MEPIAVRQIASTAKAGSADARAMLASNTKKVTMRRMKSTGDTRRSVFAGCVAELPKNLFFIEYADLEIAGAAERYRACMAEEFPKGLRMLNGFGGTWTFYGGTGNDAVIRIIERYCHELDDLGHKSSSLTP